MITQLPVLALLVAGCGGIQEAPSYGYNVVNYSPNSYIVQATDSNRVVSAITVAPASRIEQFLQSPLTQAVVYEQDCSHKAATIEPVAASYWILIDSSGNVSTPATMSDFESKGVPYQEPPLPSVCP
jgi:hypothetical protein